MQREVSRSGVTPWPTRVGSAVFIAAIWTRLMATRGTVAIGALIAIGILMAVDYLVSMWALYRRPVTLSVKRTRVVGPDGFEFTVDAPKGFGHLQILSARFNLFSFESEFCTVRNDQTTASFTLAAGVWGNSSCVRFRSELSIIGLVSARRWTTQIVPELCLVPEPVGESSDLTGVDEVGRLREYVPGDRMGTVSWGATARTGQLHVRATSPEPEEIIVVVDLGNEPNALSKDGQDIEYVVGEAMRVGEDLLAQGRTFQLIAIELVPAFQAKTKELALASPRRRPRPKLEHRPDEDVQWLYEGRPAGRVVASTIYDRDELIRRLSTVDNSPPIPRPPGPHIEVTLAGVRSVA